jgi:hypothetical protein
MLLIFSHRNSTITRFCHLISHQTIYKSTNHVVHLETRSTSLRLRRTTISWCTKLISFHKQVTLALFGAIHINKCDGRCSTQALIISSTRLAFSKFHRSSCHLSKCTINSRDKTILLQQLNCPLKVSKLTQ